MMLMLPWPEISAAFFMHCLNSRAITDRVRELTGGTASPHLNVGDIKVLPMPVPPAAEQVEIVRLVESLMKLADAIERRVTLAQTRAGKLTQSILAKAFRGKLVTSDPDGAWERNESATTTDPKVRDLKATSHKSEVSDQLNGREDPTPRVRERRATRAKLRYTMR